MFVSEPENAMTDKAHQDELNLLHIICDSNVALHSIETAIQVCPNSAYQSRPPVLRLLFEALDDGWQVQGSLTELNNEGLENFQNFERFGGVADLERAIAMFRIAVAFTPHNSPDRPGQLINLGNSYLSRFERFGKDKDIDLAIERQHEAVASTPFNSLHLPGFLNSLGSSYMRRFERFGQKKDIDSAIDQQLKAVVSTPPGSVRRPQRLNSLAISYRHRFQRFGKVKDIESAIERQREAVASAPLNSAERAARLSALGNTYLSHFQRFGEMKDIESAIEQHLEAVASTPPNSPRRSAFLQNLGTSYHSRFERLGEVKDIDLAIQRELEAVASAPPDSPDRAGQLNNLGMSYRSRFERLGEVKDINSAIERQHEAVSLTPPNSADRAARLDNLGNSYGSRFKQLGDVKDIDSAIEQQREAVVSTPPDSAYRTLFLNNLGNSHIRRFEELGEVNDIDSAIERYSEAVASTPLDNAGLQPGYLNNLGVAYRCRFEQFGKVEDINLAIKRQRDAVASTPLDSAELAGRLNSLGNSYMQRFESIQEVMDWHESLSNFRLSSISQNGLPSSRMRASLSLARFTHQLNNLQSASEAYEQAVRLLPQVAWIGLDAVAQLKTLNSKIQTLACDAAACMITLAQADSQKEQLYLGRAIELLDQGRSILWSQTSNFKQDLEELRKKHPQLADELDLAGKILGQGCFHDSNDTLSESDAQVYRRSAEKWEELVSKIRTLPDFHYFLLPPPISTLRTATVNGPVVIINSSEYRCDAVIIPPKGDLVLVPLSVTAAKLSTLTDQQEKFALRQSRIGTPLDDNDDDELPSKSITLKSVLNDTWLFVGDPIFQKFKDLQLLGSQTSATCHVWWCLTGSLSFLPIHASFPSTQPAIGMMDIVVSSYTPTISALLRAQQHRELPTFRMLAVGQSKVSGLAPLPGVTEEIAFISKRLGTNAQTLQEDKATVEEVAASLPTCSWAHFACHGVQDPNKPMNSGLVLWNGDHLTLSRLAQSSLASAEFAFLSCCQSAKGSKELPNEAIHLAAGLQFIGFHGVIGTMWSVGDDDALSIAIKVYGELFKDGTSKASPSMAALALHQAVCHLRDHVSLVRWVPFVHFGL